MEKKLLVKIELPWHIKEHKIYQYVEVEYNEQSKGTNQPIYKSNKESPLTIAIWNQNGKNS